MSELRQFYTDDELAERWNVSRWTVRRLRYNGTLKTLRVRGCPRIPVSAVEAYEQEHIDRASSDE